MKSAESRDDVTSEVDPCKSTANEEIVNLVSTSMAATGLTKTRLFVIVVGYDDRPDAQRLFAASGILTIAARAATVRHPAWTDGSYLPRSQGSCAADSRSSAADSDGHPATHRVALESSEPACEDATRGATSLYVDSLVERLGRAFDIAMERGETVAAEWFANDVFLLLNGHCGKQAQELIKSLGSGGTYGGVPWECCLSFACVSGHGNDSGQFQLTKAEAVEIVPILLGGSSDSGAGAGADAGSPARAGAATVKAAPARPPAIVIDTCFATTVEAHGADLLPAWEGVQWIAGLLVNDPQEATSESGGALEPADASSVSSEASLAARTMEKLKPKFREYFRPSYVPDARAAVMSRFLRMPATESMVDVEGFWRLRKAPSAWSTGKTDPTPSGKGTLVTIPLLRADAFIVGCSRASTPQFVVVDGGEPSTGDAAIAPLLMKARQSRHIQWHWVVTHFDSDHIASIPWILRSLIAACQLKKTKDPLKKTKAKDPLDQCRLRTSLKKHEHPVQVLETMEFIADSLQTFITHGPYEELKKCPRPEKCESYRATGAGAAEVQWLAQELLTELKKPDTRIFTTSPHLLEAATASGSSTGTCLKQLNDAGLEVLGPNRTSSYEANEQLRGTAKAISATLANLASVSFCFGGVLVTGDGTLKCSGHKSSDDHLEHCGDADGADSWLFQAVNAIKSEFKVVQVPHHGSCNNLCQKGADLLVSKLAEGGVLLMTGWSHKGSVSNMDKTVWRIAAATKKCEKNCTLVLAVRPDFQRAQQEALKGKWEKLVVKVPEESSTTCQVSFDMGGSPSIEWVKS